MPRVSSDFYRSVKVKMNLKEASQFQAFHKGLDWNFYEPLDDNGNSLMHVKGFPLHKINYLDVTFLAKSINPNRLHERNTRDIDEELAMLPQKNRVVQDHLKHTDNRNLIHFKQPKTTLLKHATLLEHPYLDGENDKLRSTATEVHDVAVPVEQLKNMEDKFRRRKAFYDRSKMDFVAKLDERTGQKVAVMKMGYIGDHE